MSNMKHAATQSERGKLACRQKWLLSKGLGLERAGDKPAPLWFGTLWHELMDLAWTAADYMPAAALLTKWKIEQAKDYDPGAEATDQVESLVLLDEMLANYVLAYPVEPLSAFTLCGSEVRPGPIRTTTPRGYRSPLSLYDGKLDKVVRDSFGQHWIVEHKTLKGDVERWRDDNDYRPQAATYGVLLQDGAGVNAVGVIYDLAVKQPLTTADMLKRTTKGVLSKVFKSHRDGTFTLPKFLPLEELVFAIADTLGLSREGTNDVFRWDPIGTDAITAFVEANQDSPLWLPWYGQLLGTDPLQPGMTLPTRREICTTRLFKQEIVKFEPGELDRRRGEMYLEATELRRMHTAVADERRAAQMAENEGSLGEWLEAFLNTPLAESFFRNPDHCLQYNRRCAFTNLCRHRAIDDAQGFRLRTSVHPELDDAQPHWRP